MMAFAKLKSWLDKIRSYGQESVGSLVAFDGGVHQSLNIVDWEFAVADFIEDILDLSNSGGENLAKLEDSINFLVDGLELHVLVIVHVRAEQELDDLLESAHVVVVPHVIDDNTKGVGDFVVASHVWNACSEV